MTTFEQVQPLADTVLYEGYMLYPYRADDAKNAVRWQFGVVAPAALVARDASERDRIRADLLFEGRPGRLRIRLRFLQTQRRMVQRAEDYGYEDVPRLVAGDTTFLPFDEALTQELDLDTDIADLTRAPREERYSVPGGTAIELVPGGRLVRERRELAAAVSAHAQVLPGPYGVTRLTIHVRNTSDWRPDGSVARDEALRRALVAAHLLVQLDGGGRFLSLTDPPEWAAGYVADCHQDGVWPVLAGAPTARDLVLCSPIILPDHPQVAPESTTEFFDATEMDEMLSLRALTLTDEEKRAVRGTDPRAAELLEHVEQLPPQLMDRLHGAVRSMTVRPRVVPHDDSERATNDGDEEAAYLRIGSVLVSEGSRVLLRPGARRTDAQDLFLTGRTATVTRVLHDLDGNDHLAVLLDDDPARDLARTQGRFLYFAPDEVEPLGAST